MRRCAKCKQDRPLADYCNTKVGRGRSYCRACRTELRKRDWATNKVNIASSNRASRLRASYGIAPEEYARRLAEQSAVCAICGSAGGRRGSTTFQLAVDHDHETGRVRGLLCQPCNTAIGLLGDSAATVRRALDYLTKGETK